jgi:AraC-like DNA-binding protein
VLSGWVGDDDRFPVAVDAFWRRLLATAGSAPVASIAR